MAAPTDKGRIGPELSMMGPLHEAEYFADAIINPGAVIEKGSRRARLLHRRRCTVHLMSDATHRCEA